MPTRKQWSFIIQMAIGVAVVLTAYLWIRSHWDPHYIARRCETHARQSTNPAELQRWAADLLRRYPPDTTNYSGPFDLPGGVAKIWDHPPHVSLVESGPVEEAHVRLLWGSGLLGHWGFRLGSTNFVGLGKMWAPGVFWWREFDR
jgi:hypothetical protein